MAKYVIRDTTLTAIGDAIREQTGKTDSLTPAEMADEIGSYLGDIRGIVGRTLTDIRHEGVTAVAPYAFYNYTTLNSIDLPNCTTIGSSAFSGCTGLTSVSFPMCTMVGANAFSNCKNIANVTFGHTSYTTAASFQLSNLKTTTITTLAFPNCVEIGKDVFNGYNKLVEVRAPVCKTLGQGAFNNCSFLETAYFPECDTFGANVFSNCKILNNVAFGLETFTSENNPVSKMSSTLMNIGLPKCESIGTDAFTGYPKLSSASLPMCRIIGEYAFANCVDLKEIVLPACSFMEYGAFYNCTGLMTVKFPGSSVASFPWAFGPPIPAGSSGTTSYAYAFDHTPIQNSSYTGTFGSIYVPASLVNAYKTTICWERYADRITAIE